MNIKERDQLVQMDIENPTFHANLGAAMLKYFRHFHKISEIIKFHHVKWEYGVDRDLKLSQVPMESFILHLADRIDILIDPSHWILDQVEEVKGLIK